MGHAYKVVTSGDRGSMTGLTVEEISKFLTEAMTVFRIRPDQTVRVRVGLNDQVEEMYVYTED